MTLKNIDVLNFPFFGYAVKFKIFSDWTSVKGYFALTADLDLLTNLKYTHLTVHVNLMFRTAQKAWKIAKQM